jgi:hypothetical protein
LITLASALATRAITRKYQVREKQDLSPILILDSQKPYRHTTPLLDNRTSYVKKMRKRLIALLFLPIAVFLWIIGWAMVWTGSHKRQKAKQTQAEMTPGDGFITVGAMIPEKPEENEA